jgi:uncharacterized protein
LDSLYIVSISPNAGKTMLAAGLVKVLSKKGIQTGYVKFVTPELPGPDQETQFMQSLLNGSDSITSPQNIQIIEGLIDDLASTITSNPLNRMLVIHDYAVPLKAGLSQYLKFKSQIKGIIVNKIPANKLASVSSLYISELDQAGLPCMGAIPENRLLTAISIEDLVQIVNGKVANANYDSSELIENIMLGSSTFDRGPAYYKRKNNKAVLVWGDRLGVRKAALAGLQVAALQTSTRCIVISHNAAPLPNAIQKADEQKVALIVAPGTLNEIVNSLEKSMANARFGQVKKMPLVEEILKTYLYLKLLDI